MPWSSGIFSIFFNERQGPNVFDQNRDAGERPTPEKFDEMVSDVVGGLNQTLTRDGETRPIADINWNGHGITNLHSETTTIADLGDRDVVNVKILKDNTTAFINSSNVTQTAEAPNLITLAFNTDPAFIEGESYEFKAKQTITSHANIVVGTGRTQKPLKARRANISFGNIVQGEIYRIVWDSAIDGWDVRDYNDYVSLTTVQYLLLLAAPITTHPQTKYILVDSA